MAGEINGDYKIEGGLLPGYCRVHKALGPWPLRNWSWITFYEGSPDQCRDYVRWAQRVDAGDKAIIQHASDWLQNQIKRPDQPWREGWVCDSVEHLPKMWRYDFRSALALCQAQPETEVSTEAFLLVLGVIAALIGAFLYHSM